MSVKNEYLGNRHNARRSRRRSLCDGDSDVDGATDYHRHCAACCVNPPLSLFFLQEAAGRGRELTPQPYSWYEAQQE